MSPRRADTHALPVVAAPRHASLSASATRLPSMWTMEDSMAAQMDGSGPSELTVSSSSDVASTDGGSAFVLPKGGVDLRDVERTLIKQALFRCHGNQTQAARLLRISRYALRSRMKKFHLLAWQPPATGAPAG